MTSRERIQKSPEELADEFKALLSDNASQSVKLAARVNDLVKDAAQAVAESGREPADTTQLLNRWLDYQLRSYAIVSKHALSMAHGLVSAAQNAVVGSEAAEAAPVQRIDLQVKGHIGEVVVAPFLVHNHYDREVTVGFEATALLSATGRSLEATYVKFEPYRASLEAGEQVVIQAIIAVTDEFEPGQTYVTTIRVLGFDAQDVVLALSVEQAQAPADRAQRDEAPLADGARVPLASGDLRSVLRLARGWPVNHGPDGSSNPRAIHSALSGERIDGHALRPSPDVPAAGHGQLRCPCRRRLGRRRLRRGGRRR